MGKSLKRNDKILKDIPMSIGLIRKRARGIRDTEYFKLKIRQTSIPDKQSMFYFGQNLTH